jgi:Uma2 family endonuclease
MAQVAKKRASRTGGIWVLDGVSWPQYSRFLRAFEDRPGFRLTYDDGTLEIMSPSPRHDHPGRFLGRMVVVLCEEFDLPLICGGSTTLRRRLKKKGAEADECFWIANAHRMKGRLDLDLRRDPPPDLAIEIDVTHSSLDRTAIYAALRVPEFWRVHGEDMQFFALQENGKYKQVEKSRIFPAITPADLMRFLVRIYEEGDENPIIRDFRKWVRSLK